MTVEHRREIGSTRAVLRREKSHIVYTDGVLPSKSGRWHRLSVAIVLCCGFMVAFSAFVFSVLFFFGPSSLADDGTGTDVVSLAPNIQSVRPLTGVDDGGAVGITLAVMDENHVINHTSNKISTILQSRRMLAGNRTVTHREAHTQRAIVDTRSSSKRTWAGVNRSSFTDNPLRLSHAIKIYVYDLPPAFNADWLADSRCSSHLFAAEVAVHQVLLNSEIRTKNPEEADYFFVPVYVSCNFSPKNGFPSLRHAPAMMKDAVEYISREAVYWNRSRGRDHIFVATHDYGACFQALDQLASASGIPHFLRNSILLQTFGSKTRHPCEEADHIQIPPYVPPQVIRKYITPSPERRERDILAYFRGKLELHPKTVSGQFYSKGIRTRLWLKYKRDRRFFLRRKRAEGYQSEMLRSVFCLAPLGWAPWSPRIVEAVMYGCVPVIIADNISLPYSHVIDWPSISLTVREEEVDNLRRILLRVVATNLTSIQRNLWHEKNRRSLMFTQPFEHEDATWHIFDLLSSKKHPTYKST